MPNRQFNSTLHTGAPVGHKFAAAGVITRSHPCAAAKALKGKRFLAGECPRLPLPECPSPQQCDCIYRKFDDRRAGPRRELEESGIRRYIPPEENRRRGRGRRSGD